MTHPPRTPADHNGENVARDVWRDDADQDDEVVDERLRTAGGMNENVWVSIADAADDVGVATGTIRHWYRTRQLPTRRRHGDHGAFLVDLDRVRALVALPTMAETAALVASAKQHEECDREIGALRADLQEAQEGAQALRLRIAELHAELAEAKRHALFGSVTSTAWVESTAEAYRGPIRPQARLVEDGAVAYGTAEDDLLPDAGPGGRNSRH